MGNDSRELNYCQGTVPPFNHSNETRGSRGIRRSWREFCSLVRRGREVNSGYRSFHKCFGDGRFVSHLRCSGLEPAFFPALAGGVNL